MQNVSFHGTICTNEPCTKGPSMPDVRIYGTVSTDRPCGKAFKLQNDRFYTTVDTDRIRIEDVRNTPRCEMSDSIEWYAQMSHASKTHRYHMQDSKELLAQFAATKGQDPLEDAFLERPNMNGFNRLFANIAHRHQHVYEIHNAEALICEPVAEILTMS